MHDPDGDPVGIEELDPGAVRGVPDVEQAALGRSLADPLGGLGAVGLDDDRVLASQVGLAAGQVRDAGGRSGTARRSRPARSP